MTRRNGSRGAERNEDRLSAGAHGWLDWMAEWLEGRRQEGWAVVRIDRSVGV
jgi:hypothetical protein